MGTFLIFIPIFWVQIRCRHGGQMLWFSCCCFKHQ